jgi:hypothetical protein
VSAEKKKRHKINISVGNYEKPVSIIELKFFLTKYFQIHEKLLYITNVPFTSDFGT